MNNEDDDLFVCDACSSRAEEALHTIWDQYNLCDECFNLRLEEMEMEMDAELRANKKGCFKTTKNLDATDLSGEILKRLGSNRHACARLLKNFGPTDGVSAVEMIKLGELTGDVGDSVLDFFLNEIENLSEEIQSMDMYDPDGEDWPDCPLGIHEYCGVFSYSFANEIVGLTLSEEEALDALGQYVVHACKLLKGEL